ncbi:hypothetical protein ACJX0J_012437 [Zea mays]
MALDVIVLTFQHGGLYMLCELFFSFCAHNILRMKNFVCVWDTKTPSLVENLHSDWGNKPHTSWNILSNLCLVGTTVQFETKMDQNFKNILQNYNSKRKSSIGNHLHHFLHKPEILEDTLGPLHNIALQQFYSRS